MVLSSAANRNILLFIRRDEFVAAEDIDELILRLNKNKDAIKSLMFAKNGLMRDIDGMMRQRARASVAFSPVQMLDYREFAEFYEAEEAVLSSYMERLAKLLTGGRLAQEIVKPRADLATIHKGLRAVVTLQERVVAVLSGIVNMAGCMHNNLLVPVETG